MLHRKIPVRADQWRVAAIERGHDQMTAHVAKDCITFLEAGSSRGTTAPGRRITAPIAAAMRRLTQGFRRRAALEALGNLSDRELADIGLTRADLPRVFDPAFAASRYAARRAGC
jgi:uncharacterized protein YjiS (DUF1127 family)